MSNDEFKYGCEEKFLENVYVKDADEYCLVIEEDIYDDETVEYANKIVNIYLENKEKILDEMIENGLKEIYQEYSAEYIKENIGKPQISIQFRKDDTHPNWKFKYAGIIDFIENKLDEHIISVEFIDDLELDEDIQLNG